jgi:hypothetical protein
MHDPNLTLSAFHLSQTVRGAGFLLSSVPCLFSLLSLWVRLIILVRLIIFLISTGWVFFVLYMSGLDDIGELENTNHEFPQNSIPVPLDIGYECEFHFSIPCRGPTSFAKIA